MAKDKDHQPLNQSTENGEEGKLRQLNTFHEDSEGKHLTTNHGVRVSHTDDSLKAGARGPTLMEDFHFREKMTHFDHERIPERVVHARGSAAHGYFQVYESMAEFTKAKFLQDPSVKTPVFVRFSTVVGFRGSADTVRDVRGFATKFYTEDGNYDLVGNNIPVFFIQDGIKFPDLVHSIKPEPHHEMPQASAAHDNFWDFISLMPESMHMIMWVLSDRALLRSYAMMEGFGVHTFRFVNEAGKARFVKFHWKPLLGAHSLVWDEVQKIAGKDPDYNRRDLWEAIEMGNYPEFELGVQIVEEEQEMAFDFDLLDATKIIPEELVPVQRIGKMVLNRNPDNFFAETEQVAFHPGHVVPGIDFTNDPLLQGRLFSYLDTQLIRLGGPNFNEIPINRPLAEVHNNQRDGYMRQTINRGKTNYFPNTRGGGCPMTASQQNSGYVHYMEKVEGQKVRLRSNSFLDFYSQALLFWQSMSHSEQQRIIEAFHFELGKVMDKAIRSRMLEHLLIIDPTLAEAVAMGIGVPVPQSPAWIMENVANVPEAVEQLRRRRSRIGSSPALSMENVSGTSIKGRKIAVLIDEGYDAEALNSVVEALKAENASVHYISRFHGSIPGSNSESVETDRNHVTTASVLYDAIFIPGGDASIESMRKQGDALHFVAEAYKHYKPIGATGAGIDLLREALGDRFQVSEYGGSVLMDTGVVTLRDSSGMEEFQQAFIRAIAQHRHWSRSAVKSVPA